MAPATTIPHKSGGHQRYKTTESDSATRHQADLAADDSDAEAGALQPVKEPQNEDGFEGFGTEGEEGNNEAQSGDSDEESINIQLDPKLQEKPVLPKDAEEEELERMIFGDSEGFRQGLENFSLDRTTGTYNDASDESGAEDAALDNVADQDLFFFDAGPVVAPAGSVAAKNAEETDDENDKPAWEDSDDERLVVSLASVPQLRKLRETADDDMVNGREYARRLRKQYERLYPTPDWATYATGKANKKRRRTMEDDESGDESASDMDVDDDDLSTQPLARLLKDADILSRTSRSSVKRRKLQAGTIDIQRLKDVAKAGPVSDTSPIPGLVLANNLYSLPLLLYHSTPPTRCYFHQGPVQRCTSIMSTRIRRIQILCSHRYTSSAPLLLRPRSIHPLQTRVSS
jgi:U3 small nucleolar RNA-associated protein 18